MKKVSWKIIAFLQIAVMIYTLSSVAAKLAAGRRLLAFLFCCFMDFRY